MPVTHTTQQTSSKTFFPITLLSISANISQGVYQASNDSVLRNTHTSAYMVIMYQIYFINKLATGYTTYDCTLQLMAAGVNGQHGHTGQRQTRAVDTMM